MGDKQRIVTTGKGRLAPGPSGTRIVALVLACVAIGLASGCAGQRGGDGSLACGPSPAPKIGEFHSDPGTPDASGSENC
jgi:hypothetical protein